MGRVVILGVFVADTAYRADRAPKIGETIMGRSFALGPGKFVMCVVSTNAKRNTLSGIDGTRRD